MSTVAATLRRSSRPELTRASLAVNLTIEDVKRIVLETSFHISDSAAKNIPLKANYGYIKLVPALVRGCSENICTWSVVAMVRFFLNSTNEVQEKVRNQWGDTTATGKRPFNKS
jgi:hypothetical protein